MNKYCKHQELQLVIIAVTGACNLQCVYCYANKQAEVTMSKKTLKALINLIKKRYRQEVPLTVQFTGGEPLLAFENVKMIIDALEEAGVHATYQIQTNGTLITEAIAQYLKKHQVAIGVSLDGVPIINDRLRPSKEESSSTDQTIRGIQLLGAENIEIGVTSVITNENIQHLSKFIDFLAYLGNVRQVGFNLLRPQGRGATCQLPSGEELQKGLSSAIERAEYIENRLGVPLKVTAIEKCKKYEGGYAPFSHCYALHKNSLYIDPMGDLYACASLSGQEKYRLGSLHDSTWDTDSEEGNRYEVAQEKIGRDLIEVVNHCMNCKYVTVCGGGCYSRSLVPGEVEPLECIVKKVYIQYSQKK